MSTERILNFSAGPATLPVEVLEEAQRDFLNHGGSGMSVMEMSHRSASFTAILEAAERDIRELLGIGDGHHVVFLQGGASLQFLMVPMNFLPEDRVADYIVTGKWSEGAVKQAKLVGKANEAASTKADGYSRLPSADEIELSEGSAYVHFTSNNTIAGTQWSAEPKAGDRSLVCDASSDFMCRPLDIDRYGLIYAGAQKNAGPAGVTIAIISDELLKTRKKGLPDLLDYGVHVDKGSRYNTPPCFAIYIVGLVAKWLKRLGGLQAIEQRNREKAALLYDAIDAGEFYRGTAARTDRSLMNVTFRLPSEDLEAQFLEQARGQRFSGLKGHRSVGGLRASIYNAFPREGIEQLVAFMKDFEKKSG